MNKKRLINALPEAWSRQKTANAAAKAVAR